MSFDTINTMGWIPIIHHLLSGMILHVAHVDRWWRSRLRVLPAAGGEKSKFPQVFDSDSQFEAQLWQQVLYQDGGSKVLPGTLKVEWIRIWRNGCHTNKIYTHIYVYILYVYMYIYIYISTYRCVFWMKGMGLLYMISVFGIVVLMFQVG